MAGSDDRSLEEIFNRFCSFGDKGSAPRLDNFKFSKLCKDMKLLDKHLTTTDVDIIFSQCKPKSERKMSFEHFKQALVLMADKKYPDLPNRLNRLTALLLSGEGPKTHGVTSVFDCLESENNFTVYGDCVFPNVIDALKAHHSPIVSRMTDTSKYTGTHKQRFDTEGKGKGLEGRDSHLKGSGMDPGSVGGLPSYVSGYKHEGTYGKKS